MNKPETLTSELNYTVVGLGELLWDLLPSGKQLGGAPANFAYIVSLLGDTGIAASRLGEDSLAEQAAQRLAELGLSAEFVQRDAQHPTGTVIVELDNSGQPRFEIREAVAWDFLAWTPQWQALAERADAVCFGTLAQRSETSRTTIQHFLRAARPDATRIFDVNLRQHFFDAPILEESMKLASIVKLNHEELPRIMGLLGWEHHDEEDSARRLRSSHNLNLVCVTRGMHGSILVSADECCEHPGFQVKVADTVGAGDAFTAAMVHGYLRGAPLAQINDIANRMGAWVASQSGGTPAPGAGGLKNAIGMIG